MRKYELHIVALSVLLIKIYLSDQFIKIPRIAFFVYWMVNINDFTEKVIE